MSDDLVWNKLETRVLNSGYTWTESRLGILAKSFEAMLDLAQPIVQAYKSDLYHDAIWLWEHVMDPCSWDWIVRESGSFIGAIVRDIKIEDWRDAAKYRFTLRQDDKQQWLLDVYKADPLSQNDGDTDTAIELDQAFEAHSPEGDAGREVFGLNQDDLTEILDRVFENPIPRNEESTTPERKGNTMDRIIEQLEGKLEELSNVLTEANEANDDIDNNIRELENAKEELKTFLSEGEDAKSEYENAISVLSNLPELSLSVNVYAERVSVDVEFRS